VGDHTPIAPACTYRLTATSSPLAPVLFKTILESWCQITCVGNWQVDIVTQSDGDAPELLRLDLNDDNDMVLFMLSSEYTYMGNPPINH
jgi:hypothetical protein